ncbi:MAG TPA: hypothetical protein VNI01_07745, partial [Elusimicrobiota bacterium]|nr:hypothetical protein [Elusimicrobiota bacterium]
MLPRRAVAATCALVLAFQPLAPAAEAAAVVRRAAAPAVELGVASAGMPAAALASGGLGEAAPPLAALSAPQEGGAALGLSAPIASPAPVPSAVSAALALPTVVDNGPAPAAERNSHIGAGTDPLPRVAPFAGGERAQAPVLDGVKAAAASVARAAASPTAAAGVLHSLFSGASPSAASPEPGAEAVEPIGARLGLLTAHLRDAEESYYRGGEARAEEALGRARTSADEALKLVAAARAPKPAAGARAWLEKAGTWLWGELREKLDVRETFRMVKKLAVTEGMYFAIYAAAIEIVEDVVVPIILWAFGHPELIPFALAFHSEPVTWPLYFVVRFFLWRRTLWKLAGGRTRYKALKDFRHRLLDEDPGRRIERLFISGMPFAAGRAVAVNVNRSLLPLWVPLWLRNLYDRDFKTYDLYISINELALIAPRELVRSLRGYYKEHPRAVSYLLARAILDRGGRPRARLIQNLAYKYWMNIGFGGLQPTLLRFFGEEERALEKASREFASHFFLLASAEERRLIQTVAADAFAASALLRLEGADDAGLLDAMAPFLPDSYPRRALSRGGLASSELALVRTHFLIRLLLREGRLAEGRMVELAGEPVAVIHGGKPHYLGRVASAMERALRRNASAVHGAEEYLERYAREVDGSVLQPQGSSARPAMAADIEPAAPQLLTRLYWVKQTLIPRRAEQLMADMEDVSARVSDKRARKRYRRDMKEQIARLRELPRRVEALEFRWLSAYYAQRFSQDETRVDGYADFARELADLETEIQAASAVAD